MTPDLVERVARAMYDDWPTCAVSPALAKLTGLPLGSPLSWAAVIEAGGDHAGLLRLARAAISAMPPQQEAAGLRQALDLARNRLRAAAVNEAPEGGARYYEYSQWADEADAALASQSAAPQQEGVGEEFLRTKLRMIVSHASGGNFHDIDASINDICVEISRHKNEIWAQAQESALRKASQPDASPPLVGVEGLRELSEKATQGEWSVDDCTNIGEGYWIMAPDAEGWRGSLAAVRAGCAEMADLADDKDNAAFIVACVNHVREALSRVSGDAR